jgi:hypothetical protein
MKLQQDGPAIAGSMILAVRNLAPVEQRQLLSLLDPMALQADVAPDDAVEEIRRVLRRSLEVPVDGDLGEYVRRRLVETVVNHFQLSVSTDMLTELELADRLISFVLDAATRLADDAESRRDFETFIRTKDRGERIRWLVGSQELAARATAEAWDHSSSRADAELLQEKPSAYRLTAKAILDDLATVASTPHGIAGIAAGAAGAGAAAALPLGALAGGLFMAGRTIKTARGSAVPPRAVAEDATDRKQRARRSTLVQTVVILSAFALTQHGATAAPE